ncbi:vWA domain-containing protein [Nocardioides sp. P5_E3]
MTADAALKIRAARVLAIRNAPYLASVLLRMVLVESDQVPTLGVDRRWRVYVNPGSAAERTVDDLAYIWLHEAGHCLRGHPVRWESLGQPDTLHGVFNIAGDALINADLDDITTSPPDDRVLLSKLGLPETHREMGVEELYRLLLEARHVSEGQATPDCGSGAAGGSRPWELPGADAQADGDGSVDDGTADLVRDIVAQEVRSRAVAVGDVPGGLSRWAEARLQPVVDWNRELRTVLSKELSQHAGRRDYTYARPGRRRVPGVVLPAVVAPAPPSVAVVIDTSGSMAQRDLARALSETRDLVQRVSRSRRPLRAIACDHTAHEAAVVRSVEQVELVGGGGTDMCEGIRAAASLTPNADLVVVITDGFTGWPAVPPRPDVRVVAVLTRPTAIDRVPGWIRAIDASAGSASAA